MRDLTHRVARAITHRVSRQGAGDGCRPAASCGTDSGCRLAFVSCSSRPAWLARPALIVFLVVGLVGHLWMQSSHTVQTAQGAQRAAAARIATHAAGDQHHGRPAEHAPVCLALPSADHPALHGPLRCPTFTAPATVWAAGEGLDIVRSQPPVYASSPRSPEHGVVLVL